MSIEVGTDMLSRNVGREVPTYAAQYPRKAKASAKILFENPEGKRPVWKLSQIGR